MQVHSRPLIVLLQFYMSAPLKLLHTETMKLWHPYFQGYANEPVSPANGAITKTHECHSDVLQVLDYFIHAFLKPSVMQEVLLHKLPVVHMLSQTLEI